MTTTLLLLVMVTFGSAADAGTPVKVLVPDGDNLQYMSFWLAKGAGYFDDEKVDVEMVVPSSPSQTLPSFLHSKADVAVLPPPVYLQLIAQKFPFVLVANLLANDPINLVVRRSVFEERKLSATAPMADRLRGIHGLRVGVAPNPPRRLRSLFASQGLDADKDIEMVILHGKEQNAAFADKRVDALYCHTPYLEAALVDQDAVVLVNQSAGEVTQLATRQIHALAVTRPFRDEHPQIVAAMVSAIARAERMVHLDKVAAVTALLHEFPQMDRRHVETIVAMYEPAIPPTPVVSVDGLLSGLALYPAAQTPPDLGGIDLAPYIDAHFSEDSVRPPRSRFLPLILPTFVLLVAGAVYLLVRRRQARARAAALSR